jgi:hypothetical protein
MAEESAVAVVENVKFELGGRFKNLDLGKSHISVRYEAAPRLVRVGACITNYTWEVRESVIDALLDFEESHADDFDVEFDVIPIDGVIDESYAEV